MSDTALYDKVVGGHATDAELEEYFGADLMNALAHQWRGNNESRAAFTQWYKAVIEPIGLPAQPAWKMFRGEITIEDYVAALSDEEVQRFLDLYPGLQAEHQSRIESGEVL